MECSKEVAAIIERMRKQGFYVYGRGGHGRKVINCLKKYRLEDKLLGWVDSRSFGEGRNIDKKTLFVIAAHEDNGRAIEENLRRLHFVNYINIYPYLIEFCCGASYRTNVVVDTAEFLAECAMESLNFVAIIYGAVEAIAGHNEYGIELYRKAICVHGTAATAQVRSGRLHDYAAKFAVGDVSSLPRAKINLNDKYILDGHHRFALAKYYGISNIEVDLYNFALNDFIKLFNANDWDDNNIQNNFTPEELNMIYSCREKILGQ